MMPSVKFDLRTARQSDVGDLRRNWRLSFGDDDDYLDFFFSRRFVSEDTLAACVNGTVVSQLFLLPATLRTQDRTMPVDYLFAAATHPNYRGMGLMGALLAKARTFCKERGKDAIVLLPGTAQLYRYYSKHGYETAFVRRRWDVTRAQLSEMASCAERTADAVPALRNILSGRDGLCWDADALSYALSEHRAFRGAWDATARAFVALSDDEGVCICAPEDFGECATLLLGLSDLKCFSLTFPADLPFGAREDGGMLCRLCEKPVQLRDAFISFAME